jgi:dTDP-4-amino-4,6-dideoxygalactose transaminase
MTLFESRASVILYNALISLKINKNIDKDGKFIIPLNVCPIVPAVFIKAKIDFDFIDISMKTLCVDDELLLAKIKREKNISGVLFVKTYGTEDDFTEVFRSIKQVNSKIFIINDNCLKMPDFEYDIEASLCDLTIFSTGYSKYVDIGWGGFGFLKDKYTYCKTKLLFSSDDLNQLTGEINKSLLENSDLKYIDRDWLGSEICLYSDLSQYTKRIKHDLLKIKKHKSIINNIYSNNLAKDIQFRKVFWDWRFSIFINNKKQLMEKIFDSGLFASSHYEDIGFMYGYKEGGNISNAKRVHSNVVNLFNDFRFSKQDAHKLVDIINKHLKG